MRKPIKNIIVCAELMEQKQISKVKLRVSTEQHENFAGTGLKFCEFANKAQIAQLLSREND